MPRTMPPMQPLPVDQRHEQNIWPKRMLSLRAECAYRDLLQRFPGTFTAYDMRNYSRGALVKLHRHGLLAVYSDIDTRVECGYFTI